MVVGFKTTIAINAYYHYLDIGTKRMLETMKIGKFLMKYAVCDVKIYTGKIYLHYKIDFS
jgi:hypothetical protein